MSLQEVYGLTDAQTDELNTFLFSGSKDKAWDKLQEFMGKRKQEMLEHSHDRPTSTNQDNAEDYE